MGNPPDPYADLLDNFHSRQREYLRIITTDESTFKRDPIANGVAHRRGFLRWHGPKPQPTEPSPFKMSPHLTLRQNVRLQNRTMLL